MNGASDPRTLQILDWTVQRACQDVEFYRSRIPERLRIRGLEDLWSIPIISRDELARLSRDILFSSTTQPQVVGLTSGSSYDADTSFLFRLRSREEAETLAALQRSLEPELGAKPLTLRLINSNHGEQVLPSAPGQISLPFEQPYHFDVIVDMLRNSFRFEGYETRIGTLVAPLQALKVLTSKLMENGIGSDDFSVAHVTTYAWRLTPEWRVRLQDYWRTPITDIYGLSEVPGLSARVCSHCNYFHFAPTAHVEMLTPNTDDIAAEGGIARLVATAFYPLAEILPILRYDTGDYFRMRGTCPSTGKPGYEFLGRRTQLIETPGHDPGYISLGLIADALDAFPEIARVDNPRVRGLEIEAEVGNPLFDAHLENGRLSVSIQPLWTTSVREEEVTLCEAARSAVAERLAQYGSTLRSDCIDVQALSTGDFKKCRHI